MRIPLRPVVSCALAAFIAVLPGVVRSGRVACWQAVLRAVLKVIISGLRQRHVNFLGC